jgi:hypothetical protein
LIRPPVEKRVEFNVPRVLSMLAAIAFAASLIAPWDDENSGWHVFGTCAWYSIVGLWEAGIALVIPAMLVTLANLTLIATAIFGGILSRRHAMPMLLLSANGLLAAALAPAFVAAVPVPFLGPISPVEMYARLPFAYWLWIAAFALVTSAWCSVVRDQRRLRIAIET